LDKNRPTTIQVDRSLWQALRLLKAANNDPTYAETIRRLTQNMSEAEKSKIKEQLIQSIFMDSDNDATST
jgi:hypothetical protein